MKEVVPSAWLNDQGTGAGAEGEQAGSPPIIRLHGVRSEFIFKVTVALGIFVVILILLVLESYRMGH